MSNRVEIICLLLEDIEDFHEKLCKEYGTRPGLHDRGLLESAVNNVYQTAFREDVYPTLCSNCGWQ